MREISFYGVAYGHVKQAFIRCQTILYSRPFFLHGSCTTDNKRVKNMRLKINLAKSWLKNGVHNVAIVL